MELSEWAKLQEELLKAQLGIIRGYLILVRCHTINNMAYSFSE